MVEHPQLATSAIRFWNRKAAGFFFLAAAAAAAVMALRHGAPAILASLMLLYCAQAFFVLLLGVNLRAFDISFPRAVNKALPLLVLGRVRRPIAELEDITYTGRSFGGEWVTLRFGDGRYPAPFATRAQRLAFFETAQANKPNVRIYRAS